MRRVALIIVMTLFSVALSAQQGTAMDFLRFDQNPSTAAMGGAALLSTSTTSFIAFSNPAKLPFGQSKMDAAVAYQRWAPTKTNYASAGFSYNINDRIGLCAGLITGIDPTQRESSIEGAGDAFTPIDIHAGVGVAYRFVGWMSAGVNVKYACQGLAKGYTLSAVLADAFVMASYKGFRGTVGVSSVGSRAFYGAKSALSDSYPVPGALSVAAGYSECFAQRHNFEAEIDVHYIFAVPAAVVSVGAGYSFDKYASVRGGYCYGGKFMPSYGSLGLGTSIKGARLDASYIIAGKGNPMGGTFALGLGYSF